MKDTLTRARRAAQRGTILLVVLLVATLGGTAESKRAFSQDTGPSPELPPRPKAPAADPLEMYEAAMAAEEPVLALETREGTSASEEPQSAKTAVTQESSGRISLLDLLAKGGFLMLPIGALSLMVVTFGFERQLALRRHKLIPPKLIDGLGKLALEKEGFDPRKAFSLCLQHPSSAANVIGAMLLKIGRPHSELEHAVEEANQREAVRLFANVRWLCLAAGISPLLGLLGTVWGMIKAFFITATLPAGSNKGQFLADGIYVALVTTLAGLAVAVPAAVLAHMFEGRIQNLLRELDETLLRILPQLERFEFGSGISQIRHNRPTPPVEATGENRIEKLFHELDHTLQRIQSQLECLEARLAANQRQHDPFALPIVRMVSNRLKAGI